MFLQSFLHQSVHYPYPIYWTQLQVKDKYTDCGGVVELRNSAVGCECVWWLTKVHEGGRGRGKIKTIKKNYNTDRKSGMKKIIEKSNLKMTKQCFGKCVSELCCCWENWFYNNYPSFFRINQQVSKTQEHQPYIRPCDLHVIIYKQKQSLYITSRLTYKDYQNAERPKTKHS